jgi:hypothetical protein
MSKLRKDLMVVSDAFLNGRLREVIEAEPINPGRRSALSEAHARRTQRRVHRQRDWFR